LSGAAGDPRYRGLLVGSGGVLTTNLGPRAMVAGLAALALGACGAAQLSSSQLRADATRVCASAAAQADRIIPPTAPAGGAKFLRRGVRVLTPELAALRSLKVPRGASEAYGSALTAFSDELDVLEAGIRELDRGADPVAAIKTVQQRLAPLESRQDAAWQALGLPGCMDR
jgi:hypothetical protein